MDGLLSTSASVDFKNGVTLHTIKDETFNIYVIKMSAADNRFNPSFCGSLSSALDRIKSAIKSEDSCKSALIVTGSGKFFSNGLDLQFLMTQPDPNQFLIEHYEPLLNKFLTFPLPTVALVNGHAFAGGMCLALALDYRVSIESSNPKRPILLSMNELLIRASIPAGMLSVLRAKLASPRILRDCIYARRWTLQEAHADGIIDFIFSSESELMAFTKSKAIEFKYTEVLESIKTESYREASSLLLDPRSDKLDPFRFAMPKSKL